MQIISYHHRGEGPWLYCRKLRTWPRNVFLAAGRYKVVSCRYLLMFTILLVWCSSAFGQAITDGQSASVPVSVITYSGLNNWRIVGGGVTINSTSPGGWTVSGDPNSGAVTVGVSAGASLISTSWTLVFNDGGEFLGTFNTQLPPSNPAPRPPTNSGGSSSSSGPVSLPSAASFNGVLTDFQTWAYTTVKDPGALGVYIALGFIGLSLVITWIRRSARSGG